jgi:hydroxymethylpyrimidine/phosphomethylpyrimidine kinase
MIANSRVCVQGRVLIVAGSDSGGGAGIQADIKAVCALGGYAMTAVTAITAQNTLGVQAVHPVPVEVVIAQLDAVLGDLGADTIKTGMLHDATVISALVETLDRRRWRGPLVVDPVMVAQSGDRLLADSALAALRGELLPRADLLTPNLPEAEALLERRIDSVDAMIAAAHTLHGLSDGGAVLVKGGHLDRDELVDVLHDGRQVHVFHHRRIDTMHTHGTGCTLASAIATGLAQGLDLAMAVARGRAYLLEALRSAPGLGRGHGPVNHAHTLHPGLIRYPDGVNGDEHLDH